MAEQYTEIGELKKVHGVKGELKFFVRDAFLEDFSQARALFIRVRGTFVPFFVEYIRGGGFPILKLEDVNDREAAAALAGKAIALPASEILPDSGREFEPAETLEYEWTIGYTIREKDAGEIGIVEEVVEMPQQEMAVVRFRGREILIPLNEDYILQVTTAGKTILMELPEGLLAL